MSDNTNDLLNQADPNKLIEDAKKQASATSEITRQAIEDTESFIVAMDKNNAQIDSNTLKMAAWSVALAKSNLQFQTLAGIDTKNITTFTDQFKTMFAVLEQST